MKNLIATAILCGCSLLATASTGDPEKESSKKEDTSNKKYSYLQVTRADVLEGDTHVFSTVVEVSETDWSEQQDEVLQAFESNLEKRFPGAVFSIGYDAVQGLFNSKSEAEQYQRQSITNKLANQQKATTVRLNISLVD